MPLVLAGPSPIWAAFNETVALAAKVTEHSSVLKRFSKATNMVG
jgi:hypothetical protein